MPDYEKGEIFKSEFALRCAVVYNSDNRICTSLTRWVPFCRRNSSEKGKEDQLEAERLTQDRVMLHEFAEQDQVVVQRSDGSSAVYKARFVPFPVLLDMLM